MTTEAAGGARLAMWSGPRNISTALMRSWENRADCMVIDEPLYGHFLVTTGIDHPGRDEIIDTEETDWRIVVDRLLAPLPPDVGVFYQKQMAHHLTPDVSHDWVASLTNVLLIRDPREVVASYIKSRSDVTPDDLGLRQQVELYDELEAAGAAPPVIDAADFLREPQPYLERLCGLVGVDFDEHMLTWPSGRRESDGVWAPYWYDTVWASTEFAPYQPRVVSLHGPAAAVADECLPYYERLHAQRMLVGG